MKIFDKKTGNLLQFVQILQPTVRMDAFDSVIVAYTKVKKQSTLDRREKKRQCLNLR